MNLVVFDLDGTIVDSMPSLTALALSVCAHIMPGVPESTVRRIYDETAGLPFREQLNKMNRDCQGNPLLHTQVLDEAALHYANIHAILAPLFPLTLLGHNMAHCRRESRAAWRFALVSSTSKRIINKMRQLWLCDFDHIYGYYDDVSKHAQIRTAMRMVDTDEQHTHYIGDTPHDLRIARDLGITFWRADIPNLLHEVTGA
jgi:phosphoglycolate phosphatase-like HAD superfamily hydrolase